MTIHLKPDLQVILEAEVASGRFLSIEEALEAAVRGLAGEAQDDLSWARPYLAEAEADVAAGRTRTHEKVWARIEERIGRS